MYKDTKCSIGNGRQYMEGQMCEEKDYGRDLQCNKWHIEKNWECLVSFLQAENLECIKGNGLAVEMKRTKAGTCICTVNKSNGTTQCCHIMKGKSINTSEKGQEKNSTGCSHHWLLEMQVWALDFGSP